ncbi:MAG: hypothetical protein ACKO24_19885 [Leptolyngbyaceae cyanobacterium]
MSPELGVADVYGVGIAHPATTEKVGTAHPTLINRRHCPPYYLTLLRTEV